jgi:hypothetical protein
MHRALYASLLILLSACADAPDGQHGSNPYLQHALSSAARSWRDGEIVERLAAGPYLYLRLREAGGGSVWLVSLRATTPPSSRVRALVLGRAERFQSRRLAREFSPLLFAAVRSVGAGPARIHSSPLPPGNAP